MRLTPLFRSLAILALGVLAALIGLPAAQAQTPLDQLPSAQEPEAEGPPPKPTRQVVEEARSLLMGEIETVRRLLADGEAPEGSVQESAELGLLGRIDRNYERQLESFDRADALTKEEEHSRRLEQEGAAGKWRLEPPPYSLALYDALRESLGRQTTRREQASETVDAAKATLESDREASEDREAARRLAKEALEQAGDATEAERLQRALRLAELESRRARVRFDSAKLILENERRELALQRTRERLLGAMFDFVDGNMALGERDLEVPFSQLDEQEVAIRHALEKAQAALAVAEGRLSRAEARVEAQMEADPVQLAELEARRAVARTRQFETGFLSERLQRLPVTRERWKRRLQVLTGALELSEMRDFGSELLEAMEGLERERRLDETRLVEIRSDHSAASVRLERAASEGRPEARWLRVLVKELVSQDVLHEEELAHIAAVETLGERALDDVRRRLPTGGLFKQVWELRKGIVEDWNTELTSVDDRPITVGKVIVAVLLFAIAFSFSRLLSRGLGWVLQRRVTMDKGAASAIQGLAFYLLLVVFLLLALRTVHIPLTAFTIVGGALAIGVGFGSQNIVNNFISGIILLAERPIKVDDIVEVDATRGIVERIGPRSTRVRTFDNIHIIVPNSAFLEKNVINWTLSDDIVRSRVDVGVAYGSPTRDVDRLIRRALEDHGQILDSPAPSVLFSAFGDNSLEFRAYFWLRVSDLILRLRIESDVRHRIDRLFRDAGIVIAFPQRDVHLDVAAPVDVRLVSPAEETETEKKK